MKIKNTLMIAAAALLLPGLPLSANTLVNDTFADNDRTTQDLPVSMAWFTGAGSSTLGVSGNAMNFTTAGNGRTILGYFGTNPAGTTGASLAIGEQLVVNFSFSTTGTVVDNTNSLRIGLFNSATSTAVPQRVSADVFGNSNAAFNGYTGYSIMLNPGATSGALRVYERTTPANDALLSTIGNFTLVGSTEDVASALATATTYSAQLVATRSAADELGLTFSITGGALGAGDYTITRTISSDITSVFDTLAFNTVSAQNLDYTFNSFEITQIPEPSTTALALLGAALAFACMRRRRA